VQRDDPALRRRVARVHRAPLLAGGALRHDPQRLARAVLAATAAALPVREGGALASGQ
jgi:hypothetical protein